jgi:thioesterase domain-containing protein
LTAFEVARQLSDGGADVPHVILLDTIAPDRRWLAPRLPVALHVRRRGLRALPALVRERRRAAGARPVGMDRDLISASYRPRHRTGRTTVIATEANIALAGDRTLGWSAHASPLEVTVVAGDHRSILREPLVGELADAVAGALRS